jgi:hypothetical protein
MQGGWVEIRRDALQVRLNFMPNRTHQIARVHHADDNPAHENHLPEETSAVPPKQRRQEKNAKRNIEYHPRAS